MNQEDKVKEFEKVRSELREMLKTPSPVKKMSLKTYLILAGVIALIMLVWYGL